MLANRSFVLLSFIFLFSAGIAQNVYLSTSNLPIVKITTETIAIPDEPKVRAHMGIIWNENGEVNRITDSYNNYNGNIAIEIRGSSSQMFPKKSYGFELKGSDWLDIDASLLGMPEEEDWILYAPYTDKSLIRNVLTFTLDAALGHYSPRCRFVELVINDEYLGLYVLMEKIKRDKNRVDIAKLKQDDVEGEELTGGYIIKIDKTTGNGGDGFSSAYTNQNGTRTFYQYDYPKQEEIQPEQKDYIYNYVREFEAAVFEKDFSLETGYRKYINVSSFVDYLLMSELSKNVDAYRLSTFLFKEKNGPLNLGPLWDINLGYGNANYYDAWKTYGFQFAANLETDYWENPFYWETMRKDIYFSRQVRDRWFDLRADVLSNERIMFVADSLVDLISQAKVRNFQKWNIIGEWIWPNYYVGPTYDAEITELKSWINQRLSWLDHNIPGWFSTDSIDQSYLQGELVQAGPNPFQNEVRFYIKSGFHYIATFNIISSTGTLITSDEVELEKGLNYFDYPWTSRLAPGMYFYQLIKGDNLLYSGKVIKGL